MSDNLFSASVTSKVHKESAIQIATFLGGPLIAGYLIAENFKHLGEPQKIRKTWLWTILSFISLIIIAAFMPAAVPNVVFAALYTGATYFIVKKYQSAQIQAHREAGGYMYKTSRTVVTGIIGALFLFAIIVAAYSLMNWFISMNR